jgi:hypothetical protein
MNEKDTVLRIANNLNESTNKELQFCLNYLSNEFDQTKESIIKLTKNLDNIEITYNKVLKEYQIRNNVIK